jgi:pimeloyl-ACP methyl ester carboxylesterase
MSVSAVLGERRIVQVPEGPIEYRVTGTGPTIVFLHGIIANGDVWRGVVEDLARDHCCITPDWPLGAHALKMRDGTDFSLPGIAQMVDRFLAAANLDNVVLVANDTGGAVAQHVVADHAQRIAALVLTPCDAFDNFVPLPIRHLRLLGRTSWGLWVLAQTLRWRWVQRLPIAFGLLTERAIPDDIMRSYTAPLRDRPGTRSDFAALVRAIDPMYTVEVARRLPGFRKPVLLAWARERRRFFPLEHAHRLAGLFPDATVEVIDDSGPFVTEDQPAAIARAIRHFVATRVEPHDMTRQPLSKQTEI